MTSLPDSNALPPSSAPMLPSPPSSHGFEVINEHSSTHPHVAVEIWLKGQLCCFIAGVASGGLTLLLSGDWVQTLAQRPAWLSGNPGLSISMAALAIVPPFTAAWVVDRWPLRVWIIRRLAATAAGVAHFALAWLLAVECIRSTRNGASTLASIHGDFFTLRPSPHWLFLLAMILAFGLSIALRGNPIPPGADTKSLPAGSGLRSLMLAIWSILVPLACILLLNASQDAQSFLPTNHSGNVSRIYVLLEGVTTDKADLSEGSPVRLDGEQIGSVTQVIKSSGWRKQIRELELTLAPGHLLERGRFDSQTIAVVQGKPFLFGSDYVELLARQSAGEGGSSTPGSDTLPLVPVIAGLVAPSSTEAQLTQQVGKVLSQSETAINELTKTAGEARNTATAATGALQEAQKRLVDSRAVLDSVTNLANGADGRLDRIELQLKVRLQEIVDMLYEKLGGKLPPRSTTRPGK